MNDYEQNNRRQHIRVQPERGRPIEVDINGEDFIEVLRAVDVSMGGMGIDVAHRFKGCRINRSVSVIVTLPTSGGRGFQVDGRIRHVKDRRFGIQFVGLADADHKQLKRYIASRLTGAPWSMRLKQRLGWI